MSRADRIFPNVAGAFSDVFKSYLKLSIQCGRMPVDALPLGSVHRTVSV